MNEPLMILAPIAGAVASSLVRPGSWEERIRRVLAGSLFGVFCGPAAADATGLPNDDYRLAVGFLCGVVGAMVLGGLTTWLGETSFAGWVKRATGWEGPKPEPEKSHESGK